MSHIPPKPIVRPDQKQIQLEADINQLVTDFMAIIKLDKSKAMQLQMKVDKIDLEQSINQNTDRIDLEVFALFQPYYQGNTYVGNIMSNNTDKVIAEVTDKIINAVNNAEANYKNAVNHSQNSKNTNWTNYIIKPIFKSTERFTNTNSFSVVDYLLNPIIIIIILVFIYLFLYKNYSKKI